MHRLENITNNNTDINNKNQTYIIINNELLKKINNHVNEIIINNISPKEGYDIFLKTNEEFIDKELNEMLEKYNINDKDICRAKIKKCYKNKYYLKSNNNKKE